MQQYASDRIRNVAVLSHDGAGKTAVVESLLLTAGAVNSVGKGQNNKHILDFNPEEIERNVTIQLAVAPAEWKEYKFNFLDTPGYAEFSGEVKEALRASDCMLIVVSAAAGVEVDTERAWDYANELNMPRMIFVNKMDAEKADFFAILTQMRQLFGKGIMPLQIPIGEAGNFNGIIDVIKMQAWQWKNGKVIDIEIPTEYLEKAQQVREMAIEAAAEGDDELLAKYLDGESFSIEEIRHGLRAGMANSRVAPVMCGSALKNIGMDKVLDRLIRYLPDASKRVMLATNTKTGELETIQYDSPFSAFVFKTVIDPYIGKLSFLRIYSGSLTVGDELYNVSQNKQEKCNNMYYLIGKQQKPLQRAKAGDIVVVPKLMETQTGDTFASQEFPVVYRKLRLPQSLYTVALIAKQSGDEEKLANALSKIAEEDLTCQVEKDQEGQQLLLHCMGKVHLEHILTKIERRYNISAELAKPYIPYRETILQEATAEGKYKKQSGGHGQYGHVVLKIEPSSQEFEFADSIVGGSVPRQYIPGVEKGVSETLAKGVIAGFPLVNIKVTLIDGSFHSVDSSELAFKIAAAQALRKAVLEANPTILEPIYNVDITIPDDYTGEVIGDLNSKRARILGVEQGEKIGTSLIKAQVPLTEMYDYVTVLRSLTQGRGVYSMYFDAYEEAPKKVIQEVIALGEKNKLID